MNSLEHSAKKTGTRCQICTGCGRCADVQPGRQAVAEDGGEGSGGCAGGRLMRVLTADRLGGEKIPLQSAGGERLVTADIGTTTIALQLYAPDGTVAAEYVCVNPQVKYGADVLSRIQAAENAESRAQMRRLVTGELQAALDGFARSLEAGERMRMVLAGNTTMIYLLLGHDPAELGRAPFHASRLEAVQTEIAGVLCSVFPGQSAFVGGDITAGIYACGMHERKEPTLLIDLGTNGEMALGSRERVIACATAAGPAFEGGVNRGVWGADMVSILAALLERGVMDETGLLADAYFDRGIRIHDVLVTQESIRAVQLAKAAVVSGIRILAREYGLGENGLDRIGKVVLAGGFGYYLRPEDAAAVGLLPAELAGKAAAGGNTALLGCLRAGRELLGTGEAGAVFENMRAGGPWNLRVINLAGHPDFEKWYIDEMNFPEAEK